MQDYWCEAQRRIEKARRINAEHLDLEDLELAELPPELGGLPHLRGLYVSRALADLSPLRGLTRLQRLNLWQTQVTDLSPLSGLTELQSLDLRETRITDLSPLSGLPQLQNLDLRETRITDLSPLSGLTQLQRLGLRGTRITDLSPLSGLTRLRALDLQETEVKNLSPLRGLMQLHSLDLWETRVEDVSPLRGLKELRRLHMQSTRVADVSPLCELAGLLSLDLWGTEVTDLSPLSGLTDLGHLVLGDGVTDLSPLRALTHLHSLDLAHTSVTDLSPLSGLTRLSNLAMAFTSVGDLSPLSTLTGIESLDLKYTSITDLSPLRGMTKLQSLDLEESRVADLSPLSALTKLESLNLSGTWVTDVSPLSAMTGLHSLYLSRTHVADLSPLQKLTALKSLYLSETEVSDVSVLFGLDDLRELDLMGIPAAIPGSMLRIVAERPRLEKLWIGRAAGVPREVLSQDDHDMCLERLRTYFAELDLGAEAEDEVKVILLGNSRVGKTQLCRRIRGERYDENVESTHGVQIWRQRQRLSVGGTDRDFQINWWDFGGQDIYHGTHALFLQSRAVFVILWTPRLENRKEWNEDGIPQRNQPLAYWLDYVRSLAGQDSGVIVVQSQCDASADRRRDPPRPDRAGFFECCAYSAKTDLGHKVFEGHLRDALRSLFKSTGPLQIGRGRAKLRRCLYEWRTKDQKRMPEARRHRTLTLDDFRALCAKTGGIVSWRHALDYLHQTGVVFYHPCLFDSRIVLDQDWALDAVYTVFHRAKVVPLLRDSGRFTRQDLALIAWPGYSVGDQRLFLELMESCGICFPCGETAAGEPRYLAPDLLPSFDTIKGRLYAWMDEPGMPTLRLDYRFFHPAVIRDLMRAIGRRAGEAAEYWKYGLWLKDAETGGQLLVKLEDTSTDAVPGAGALVLQVQGGNPVRLLCKMRKTALERTMGPQPEELLTLDGTTVARSALAAALDGRVLDVRREAVSAAPFIAFFADDGGESSGPGAKGADCGASGRQDQGVHGTSPMSEIVPAPLTEDEKPREIYLTYAWGDDSPAGRLRTQAVDRLEAALAADGYTPVRDRSQVRPGDRISAFIRRLTRADIVVAVISEKYLRSPYCMYEIYKLWQRCQADADDLAERLVPLILPDVKIGSLEERVSYMTFWSDRAEKLEALGRDPRLQLSRESWEEVRQVREFAHHVDGILTFLNNVLMPRNLDAHLADDFAAVREAVRRLTGSRHARNSGA